jgi:RHS repeat-associated protein
MVAVSARVDANFFGEGGRSPDRSLATWGEEFFVYGRSSDRRDSRNRYRFIGVERDEDTGLGMTGPRTYDPVTGRFLQGDPKDGGTAFVYARGNPLRRIDSNGYADVDASPDPGVIDGISGLTSDQLVPGASPLDDLKVAPSQQQELWAAGLKGSAFVGPRPPELDLRTEVWQPWGTTGNHSGRDCLKASKRTAEVLESRCRMRARRSFGALTVQAAT